MPQLVTYHIDEDLEDQLLAQVSGEQLMKSTRQIAENVRLSGTHEELESFQWVAAELERYGYETELLHHDGYISLPGEARLTVEQPAAIGDIDCITHSFTQPTPANGVTGSLVYVPSDSSPSRADIAGKIVLTEGLGLGASTERFEQLGAIAQIYIHDDYLHETISSVVWGSPTDEKVHLLPDTPGVSIRRTDGERLKAALTDDDMVVTLRADVDTGWRKIPLLVAEHPDLQDRDDFVLFSSHIDSWHHGAMDNGSADATVLEVARLLAGCTDTLRRGLRLAFWSGHSHGRFCGSAWYADNYWHDLYENCVCHVYSDSTGGIGASIVTEAPVMPETKRLATDVIGKITGEEFEGKRIGRFADQSFYGVGLPSIFGTLSEQDASTTQGGISFKTGGRRAGGLGWWWHTPHDTMDKVDEANLVRDTKIYLATVFRLCNANVLPLDYRAVVDDVLTTVDDLQTTAGSTFDLSELRTALVELRRRVETLYEPADGNASSLSADRVNRTLIQLSRHLVPVNFHDHSRFEHDRAESMRPVPSLQEVRRLAELAPPSDDARFLRTRLVRQYNWVLHEVNSALDLLK